MHIFVSKSFEKIKKKIFEEAKKDYFGLILIVAVKEMIMMKNLN